MYRLNEIEFPGLFQLSLCSSVLPHFELSPEESPYPERIGAKYNGGGDGDGGDGDGDGDGGGGGKISGDGVESGL